MVDIINSQLEDTERVAHYKLKVTTTIVVFKTKNFT